MKFIVDTNVGKLAKWLRMLGFDTSFFTGKQDAEIISQALKDNRILLTRDTHLMEWGVVRDGRVQALLVKSDDPDAQVLQVICELDIKEFPKPFSLCIVCNFPMVEVTKSEIQGIVPPYVLQTQDEFTTCPICHRVFWRGTHWTAMMKRIDNLKPAN
jgi:uncharacterized protein